MKARKGNSVKQKLCMVVYGPPFAGKSTIASEICYFKREDGRPFRVLAIDCESGGLEECLTQLESNGVNTENVYVVYTQSHAEVKDCINKVANREPFYELDEEGNEIDDSPVLDADGEVFHPDAIILDGSSVLKMTMQQSLIALSKKRNKLKAERAGATGEEKFVIISNSGMELKDWQALNHMSQDLVLSLMASGVHVIITAREKESKIVDGNGNTTSVKYELDSFKSADYNAKGILRLFRNEDNQVCAMVEKDRTRTHEAGEVIVDPSLLDWEQAITNNKDKPEFILKNDMKHAVETDQKLFERDILGSDAPTETAPKPTESNATEVRKEIMDYIKGLTPPAKSEVRNKLKESGLPDNFSKTTDIETLNKILAVVKG